LDATCHITRHLLRVLWVMSINGDFDWSQRSLDLTASANVDKPKAIDHFKGNKGREIAANTLENAKKWTQD
ncbi:unnamed protein product, partial [Ceratitis capitata]